MKFPISNTDRAEIARYGLRCACLHCFFYVQEENRCAHEWPSEDQEKWPLVEENDDGLSVEISLCKEFELR